ncbi:MAG: D-inositol-3-phosphate glycosyltransferase [Baekduia sp.]|nr:D-inositol-3-phosphate glycosyltransferase [Baekduia sp.]
MTTVLIVEQGEGLWGAQRYLLRLAPLLEEHGVRQILAAPGDSATAEAWRADGRRHEVLPTPEDRSVRTSTGSVSPVLALREAGRTAGLARRTAALARRVEADVIHANSHWSHLEGVGAARLARLPVVLHLHEENEHDVIGRLRGLAVLAADASIAVSGAVARSLGGRAADRAIVIRNGIDADALHPEPARPEIREELTGGRSDTPVLLSLSRLDPRKGVDQLIRAVGALPPDLAHTRLAIAGAPSLVPEHGEYLRSLAVELLGNRVLFLGPRSDVPDLLRAADALVLASSLEGLPLSVLEAQACGTPVVAYPTAGIPEIVTDGQTGLLARPDDPAHLAERLAELLRDDALSAKLSEQGRRRVLAESTLQLQAARQADLLADLVARKPRRKRA